MTVRAACANSAWNTAATWATVDSTSYSNSESANTALTTSYVSSSTFTPGAITIDGIAVKIASRAASPTGTMSINLRNTTDSTDIVSVTVNVSDIPTCTATSGSTTPVSTAEGGWFFVQFASTLLVAGKVYAVQAKTSSSSQVNLWSSATTNWSRYLRTTTTGNMTTGDDAIITGEWTAANACTTRTVTMDENATTDYGSNTTSQVTPSTSICKNGSLVWTTGATTRLRQSGYMIVYNGGTLSIGASGAEIARANTAKLEFDCAANGDFGLVVRNLGTVNMYGLSRTNGNNTVITTLAADAAAAATALTTSASTGWLNGDSVCYAPTTQTATQFEKKALTADAVGTALTSTALTNAHSGTSPTQAEVGLLTRNVVYTQVNNTFATFCYIGATAVCNMSFTQFDAIGSSVLVQKRGLVTDTTTGTFVVDHCSFSDSQNASITINTANSTALTISNSVFYNFLLGVYHPNLNSGTWTIDNCMFCGSSTATSALWLLDVGGTVTNSSFSGVNVASNQGAIYFDDGNSNANASSWVTFSGNSIHSNNGVGWYLTSASTNSSKGTATNCNFWRNAGNGVQQNSPQNGSIPFAFVGCNFFGQTNNVSLNWSGYGNIVFDTCTLAGDSSFATTNNISFHSGWEGQIVIWNSQFSIASGIKVAATSDFNFNQSTNRLTFSADSSSFGATNLFNTTVWSIFPNQMLMTSQNHGGVANDNRTYVTNALSTWSVIQSDSGTVHGGDPLSQKMTPGSAGVKLRSTPFYIKASSGQTPTVGVYVQKNGTYNGAAPRLIALQQNSMGVTADAAVGTTFTAGTNTWQQLTYTAPAAPQDGVYAFCVDCDGTAGAIFVGDWSQS